MSEPTSAYRFAVNVTPKPGILDPQGKAVERSLPHLGLTGVWSHTEGFPRTRFMICDGATDEEAFKRWTRRRQLPTQVWYSSYPASSIDNIRNAIAVREGLRAHLGEKECRTWLTRL